MKIARNHFQLGGEEKDRRKTGRVEREEKKDRKAKRGDGENGKGREHID